MLAKFCIIFFHVISNIVYDSNVPVNFFGISGSEVLFMGFSSDQFFSFFLFAGKDKLVVYGALKTSSATDPAMANLLDQAGQSLNKVQAWGW